MNTEVKFIVMSGYAQLVFISVMPNPLVVPGRGEQVQSLHLEGAPSLVSLIDSLNNTRRLRLDSRVSIGRTSV